MIVKLINTKNYLDNISQCFQNEICSLNESYILNSTGDIIGEISDTDLKNIKTEKINILKINKIENDYVDVLIEYKKDEEKPIKKTYKQSKKSSNSTKKKYTNKKSNKKQESWQILLLKLFIVMLFLPIVLVYSLVDKKNPNKWKYYLLAIIIYAGIIGCLGTNSTNQSKTTNNQKTEINYEYIEEEKEIKENKEPEFYNKKENTKTEVEENPEGIIIINPEDIEQ